MKIQGCIEIERVEALPMAGKGISDFNTILNNKHSFHAAIDPRANEVISLRLAGLASFLAIQRPYEYLACLSPPAHCPDTYSPTHGFLPLLIVSPFSALSLSSRLLRSLTSSRVISWIIPRRRVELGAEYLGAPLVALS